MKEKFYIGKQFLITILESLKNEEQIEGFAFDWLEEIIEISYLNDFKDLMEDALKLRNSKDKHGAPWKGAMTNFELSSESTEYVLPKDKIEIEKKYSYKKVEDFVKMKENSKESYLYIKNSEEIKKAIQKARDYFELELIACSLVMNGEFEAANKIIQNELSEFGDRINIVKTAMCIEFFRRNELERAKIILDEIRPEKENYWENLFLAKGILGYEPWEGYPNSDY